MNKDSRVISNPPAMQGRTAPTTKPTAANTWKTSSQLSDALNTAVFECEEYFSQKSLVSAADASTHDLSSSNGESFESVEDFYSWYSKLESSTTTSSSSSSVSRALLQARRILQELELAQQSLAAVEAEWRNRVDQPTEALHSRTEQCQREKRQLQQLQQELRERLHHYRQLDVLSAQLMQSTTGAAAAPNANNGGIAAIRCTDPAFTELLQRLDESARFVRQHSNYAQAEKYALRYAQLQQRALSMLRDHIVTQLRQAAEKIAVKVAQRRSPHATEEEKKNASEGASRTAESLYYIEFRAVAPSVKPHCGELERRALDVRGAALLDECVQSYVSLRRQLCIPTVRINLQAIGRLPELPKRASEGVSYLSSLAHLETQLYHSFFDRPSAVFGSFLAELAELWTDEMQTQVLSSHSVQQLATLAPVLKQRAATLSTTAPSMAAWLTKLHASTLERLIFLAQLSIREGIRENSDPQDDRLNYPQRLIEPEGDRWGKVSHCVLLLRRLHMALEEGPLFDGLAQEALLATMVHVVSAASKLQESVSPVDSHLFLMKHAAILRDETRDLHVSRPLSERGIDFQKLRQAIVQLASGQLTSSLRGLLPELQTQAFDARKDLEILMVHTQEAFVVSAVGPCLLALTGLLARCAAFQQSSSGVSLQEEAFLKDEKLLPMLSALHDALSTRLPESLAAVKLYLPAVHRGPVFSAVQAACLEPLSRLRSVLSFAAAESPVIEYINKTKQFVERTCVEML